MEGLPKRYDPHQVEEKLYQEWEEKNYFAPRGQGQPYTIPMPPPNITGELHMGHALNNTLQDILTRWRRMAGDQVLWLPGTDHASIATEARVAANLKQEGKGKEDLGREEFLRRVWQWKEKYGGMITEQLRRLGSSCDWSRERFTMDDGLSEAVKEAFIRLYEKDLIYRGHYIVNWCPYCQTTLSDIEVEHQEKDGKLYHLRYPLADGDGELIIATTRPETMLGDTAVAVHPDDDRYRKYIGREINLPLLQRPIPVIADSYVDPEFGTGALKITPGHDPNDFEVGQRHDLPRVNAMDEKGYMSEEAGPYAGLERYQAREKVLQDLEEQGLLAGVEDYQHAVGHCYRCDQEIEPLVSRQWFVKMKPLARPAIEAVQKGDVCFVPARFDRIYLQWMEDIRDWCISRQLWWGHRIPVWYCQDCAGEIVAREEPGICPQCGTSNLEQDPDVLDTWFSSALWPFSTLGWPQATEDLQKFFPADVLVTARDIIFFWVARMIFSSLEFMEEAPFDDVLIHGLILDAEGKKMSKSMGTGIDPLDIIREHGADALRFALVNGFTLGNDNRFRHEKVEAGRNFTNKLWNASRFFLMNLGDFEPGQGELKPRDLPSRWILSRMQTWAAEIDEHLKSYRFSDYAREIYEYIWNEFCDWYIEMAKPALQEEGNAEDREETLSVLWHVLAGLLKMLHPIMPFVSEEIWKAMPGTEETIMYAPWPRPRTELIDREAEDEMEILQGVIRNIRNLRQELDIPPGRKIKADFFLEQSSQEILEKGAEYLYRLAGVEDYSFYSPGAEKPEHAVSAVIRGVEICLPLAGIMNLEEELNRLAKQKEKLEQELARVEKQLNNKGFLENAPAHLIRREKEKQKEYREDYDLVCQRYQQIRSALNSQA